MLRHKARRFVPIIIVIIVIVLSIVTLVSLARAIFFSGSSSTDTQVVDTSRNALLSTTADRAVSVTVRGPIVADEEFRSYRITVTPSSRTIQTFKGYLATPVETKTLPNTVAAYEQFVYALDKASATKGQPLEGDKNDVRGVCASGQVYEFRLIQNNADVEMLWTSTCDGSKGSLKASASQLTSLFIDQVPDADQIIRNLDM